ncbi:MAG: pyridoxine 5'-phosphate synthase [Chlamydiae bacterium]|nr:pyridoxine 5'-phosphate synthase [Chlamydiota bacterium]MBI3266630.1 pyridoxine 5'-phosphate synthase [Chlamydiota bacterium]
MIHLGVNIDHVSTLRQVREAREPDPVWAAAVCELSGAHNITVHLREDRRHIQDRDLEILKKTVRSRLNLEMASIPSILKIALQIKPDQVTLVPEKREELTTEGGLDVERHKNSLQTTLKKLQAVGIAAGLFIEPNLHQVEVSQEAGAQFVEFHTGNYANAATPKKQEEALKLLFRSAQLAHQYGLVVHAGHGLHYLNILPILKMPYLEEVNIGHAIVSRAIFVGLERAVKEMLALMKGKDSD